MRITLEANEAEMQKFTEWLKQLLPARCAPVSTFTPEDRRTLGEVLDVVKQIKQETAKIMVSEAELKAALEKVDATTTALGVNVAAIGTNVGAIGTVSGTIATEVTALLAKLATAGVSQALLDQLGAIGTKAELVNQAADLTKQATEALIPVLNGIAAQGATDVVPVPVPVPMPEPATP